MRNNFTPSCQKRISILIHLQAQAIFTLAWFHAIVQERRVFIPQGWAKFYEFSDGDLRAGLEVLDQLSKRSRSSSNLDWETVHGLYSNAIYGGRVDDVHDIRILCSYLQEFFKQDVISGNARPRCEIFGFFLLKFPQNEKKYVSFAQFVYFLREVCYFSIFE